MKWKLEDDALQFTGPTPTRIPAPNQTIATGSWHELVPDLCRFRLTGDAALKVSATSGAIRLTAAAAGRIELAICPLIPLFSSGSPTEWACWPLISHQGAPVSGLVLSAAVAAGFELELTTKPLLDHLAALGDQLDWKLLEAVTSLFQRTLLRAGGQGQGLGQVRLSGGQPRLQNGALVLENVGLSLGLTGATPALLALQAERVTVGLHDLRVRLDGGKFSARLRDEAFVLEGANQPLTLQFHRDTEFRLCPALADPRVEALPPAARPALTVFIPGGRADDLLANPSASGVNDRFILDFKASAGGPLSLGANGLTGTAEARPAALSLGSEGTALECEVTGGKASFQDGRYDAQVTATARLPYFKQSEGSLTVRASSEGGFSARWELSPGQTWTDPTGHLEVHEPKAAVTIGRADGKWRVSGHVGGRLELIKTPRFLGDAGRWLEQFARGLRLEFDNLNLADLGNPAAIRVTLQPVNLPRGLDLWGLFKLDLTHFELLSGGFGFGGNVGFDLKGLSFAGRLPRLRCRLSARDGISIRAEPEDALSVSGQLSTPGGVKARLAFRRHQSERVDELVGSGSLTVPGLPAVTVLCMLGRRQNGAEVDPVFLLYAEADIPVPLFPGIVLRELGIGFGVNKVLAAINDVPPDQVVAKLMRGPLGLPDAGAAESWATPKAGFDLSLVAQTGIAPSSQGDGPFPYAGRATLYARPTTDFVILLGANLWLMTSLSDSRQPEFKARPAMKGALVLFPRHGFLEMEVRTERDPKSSAPIPLLGDALKVVSGEFYLKASRDTFLFRAGPFRAGLEIAGVELRGQAVYAVYVGSRGAITVMQASLEGAASLGWDCTLGFGPLSVTAGFGLRLALAFETVFAGMYLARLRSPALYARARVYILIELTARLTIRFHLVIKIWRFRKTISWSKSFGATLRLSVDMRIEFVLSSNPALYGLARIEVRLFGYSFAPQIKLGDPDHPHLTVARTELASLLTPPANA